MKKIFNIYEEFLFFLWIHINVMNGKIRFEMVAQNEYAYKYARLKLN
ncbi:hypothetical protein [Clostridium tertium]|nr:hypothetical protein [Clostridium tertium]MDB1969223.1 hypothetical protein [Clostridium tertium]